MPIFLRRRYWPAIPVAVVFVLAVYQEWLNKTTPQPPLSAAAPQISTSPQSTAAAAPAAAQQHCSGPQLGTWKLQSFVSQELTTGQKSEPLGAYPIGYLSYGSDCRMQVIITRNGRKAPANLVPTDAERIELYSGLEAYAGTYSIEGDIVSHHIETSWNQAWTGTTQSCHFKIDGRTLRIENAPAKSVFDGREGTAVLVWTKVE